MFHGRATKIRTRDGRSFKMVHPQESTQLVLSSWLGQKPSRRDSILLVKKTLDLFDRGFLLCWAGGHITKNSKLIFKTLHFTSKNTSANISDESLQIIRCLYTNVQKTVGKLGLVIKRVQSILPVKDLRSNEQQNT